ncbi:hypothetical protein FGG08_007116 [Glutinoglossum americanum]|uniref:Gamma-glutamylcyclotransferase AIG2-like domain-containing protein n=1 Tax=Glutinoglossum americanum TaxID=1670608 RepID=A0A9P8HUX1_9PEZI|nr:hypothetical protein FGG08_007116 [Glutinoglossum americanum]
MSSVKFDQLPHPAKIMARMFLNGELIREADLDRPFHAFRKELYFFYGTLMDPATLVKALNLQDPPVLLPARIIGYCCMLWDQYPALLDGPLGATVHGMVYEAQSPEEVEL